MQRRTIKNMLHVTTYYCTIPSQLHGQSSTSFLVLVEVPHLWHSFKCMSLWMFINQSADAVGCLWLGSPHHSLLCQLPKLIYVFMWWTGHSTTSLQSIGGLQLGNGLIQIVQGGICCVTIYLMYKLDNCLLSHDSERFVSDFLSSKSSFNHRVFQNRLCLWSIIS